MKGFRSVGSTQHFLGSFSRISPHFRPRRHTMPGSAYRTVMKDPFTNWSQITGSPALVGAA
jgi:putative transposase